jgi:ACS family tartrate transporter-like MFS transporter
MTHDPSPAAHPPTLADRLMGLLWRRPAPDLGERTRRRVVVHLIPYLLFLYFLAYLDRTNVSVAALDMQRGVSEGGLGFTKSITGFGAGIFFWGYWILEIPSTLSVLRWGARWVFVRILILWGLCCTLIGFIGTPWADHAFGWLPSVFGWVPHFPADPAVAQFYFLRFMLGFFEGGFFPSVIFYLSLWFRPLDRAKAVATFMSAIPVSNILGMLLSGGMLSGGILRINWLGLSGWRWIFILQGLVPILAGFVTLFFLPDRPEKATWLPGDERDWLRAELHREYAEKQAHGHFGWVSQAGMVLLLTGYYFCMNVASYGLTMFMPQIVKSQSGLSSVGATLLTTLFYLMSLIGMLINGWHSDRTRERIGHTVVPLTLLGVGIFLAALLDGVGVWPVVVTMLTGLFLYAHLPAFWPIPSVFLGAAAAASAIGFINMIGNLGGFVGPVLVGESAEGQTSFATSLFILAPFPLFSVAFILAVGYLRRDRLRASRS